MVVVSGTWVKNVAPYSPQIDENIVLEENETMAAQALLIRRPNSHHFHDRTLTLDQPIKVGRSVARAKATSTNAIFDCKVLSRHHALLWYEDGKFYLQDTKSSNGTFVNNNRLTTENHEVSSGDIVQFGVDVVENNRKVTHGCIIAVLKLYLPDGKEAKASPSITEGETHGVVPLDDLYKLNQILQEANQREQCLESKLNALQNVVDETKRSAEDSWQAYVGEERLLSRLSALETQLQQARTNWSEDRLKEEISKLRENNEEYQEAAKGALEKVHTEKQQAIVSAMEQERAKISAEQDALLAREQLDQAHIEIQEIAQKLTEIQTKADEEKQEHEKQVRELEQHMEEEEAKIIELEAKIYELTLEISKKHSYFGDPLVEERPDLIFENDLKLKEEMIAENELMSESILNNSDSNGFEQNHINLTVAPVEETFEEEKTEDLECESMAKDDGVSEVKNKEDGRRVSFNLPEEGETTQEESPDSPEPPSQEQAETRDFTSDHVESKTLKYQYQSAQKQQRQMERDIMILEKHSVRNKQKIANLDKALSEEKELSGERLAACECLREELAVLEQKWQESSSENQKLIERVNDLVNELEKKKEEIVKHEQDKSRITTREAGSNDTTEESEEVVENKDENEEEEKTKSTNNNETEEEEEEKAVLSRIEELSESVLSEPGQTSFTEPSQLSQISNTSIVSCEQLMNIEEELVLLKERYAQSCEEKVKLQRDLVKVKVQYEMVCTNMYNKYFWYVGPLVVIVVYLLIREWIS